MTNKEQEEVLRLLRLLAGNTVPLANWCRLHSPDDRVFASAVAALKTIEDIERFFATKEEPKEKLKQLDLFN